MESPDRTWLDTTQDRVPMNRRARRAPGAMDEVLERAREIGRNEGPRKIAVAGALDASVLKAVAEAEREGIVRAHMIGPRDKILALWEELGIEGEEPTISDVPDDEEICHVAARLAKDGAVDIAMKGFINTSLLLRTLLSGEYGLRRKPTVSHTAVLGIPRYHKLLIITDGGVVVKPDLQQKRDIIENAIEVSRALGVKMPKVALLAAAEVVTLRMRASMEDAVLAKMGERGLIRDAVLDGPFSFDVAVSRDAAEFEGIESEVAGDADIIVVGSIEEGNIISKTVIEFADATFGGLIWGLRLPVSLVSRADTMRNKKAALAVAAVVSSRLGREGRW
jgi:phosphate butyryltransferase